MGVRDEMALAAPRGSEVRRGVKIRGECRTKKRFILDRRGRVVAGREKRRKGYIRGEEK